jgi:small-conductance mechanosensitive channel
MLLIKYQRGIAVVWQWFLDSGIYIIIVLIIGTVLVFLTTRLSKVAVRFIAPKNTTEEFQKVRRILANTMATVLGVIITFVVISFIVSRFGIDMTPVLNVIGDWFTKHGIVILFIIIGAFIINKVINLLLPSIIDGLVKARGKGKGVREERKKRAGTLSRFLGNVITGIIGIVALFMLLSEIGVDIAPLLVGAGFVGIAVGFAGQKVISDILNGLFIIIENYYNVGDVVKAAGISGVVEDMNIRRTILRDLDGIVHVIPNSQIDVASNYTKNWSRVNLNIPVAYGEDLEKVTDVLNKVGMKMAEDEYFGPLIINAPQVLRVDNFGDSGIEIKILGETKPSKQWEVTGELRKRIKKVFDEERIEIPWPHTKVYFGNTPRKNEIEEKDTSVRPEKPRKQHRVTPGKTSKTLPPDTSDDD